MFSDMIRSGTFEVENEERLKKGKEHEKKTKGLYRRDVETTAGHVRGNQNAALFGLELVESTQAFGLGHLAVQTSRVETQVAEQESQPLRAWSCMNFKRSRDKQHDNKLHSTPPPPHKCIQLQLVS